MVAGTDSVCQASVKNILPIFIQPNVSSLVFNANGQLRKHVMTLDPVICEGPSLRECALQPS